MQAAKIKVIKRKKLRLTGLFFILPSLLMLMPFQVTMLLSYLVLDSMKLIDTHAWNFLHFSGVYYVWVFAGGS